MAARLSQERKVNLRKIWDNKVIKVCVGGVWQGCHFSAISLISGKNEVPFQGNACSFSEKDIGASKSLVKVSFFGSRLRQIVISRFKNIPGGHARTNPYRSSILILREKHFLPVTPLVGGRGGGIGLNLKAL